MDIYYNNIFIGSINRSYNVSLPQRIDYYTWHRVNDEVRGYLVHNGIWTFIPPSSVQPCYKIKKLALVLESPHKDEYIRNKVAPLIPIRPANGFAGKQIDNYIQYRPWISQLNSSYAYEVFIMNAIQYQCSAVDYVNISTAIRRLTDAIFIAMWNYKNNNGQNVFQVDFLNRINNYSPDIIINACTNGTRNPSLQSRVSTLIRTGIQKKDYTDYHPATLGEKRWK